MQEKKLDLVTICYGLERRLLQLQARSIRLYMPPSLVGSIVLIINDKAVKKLRTFIEKTVLPEYGPLQNRVHILDYKAIMGTTPRKSGWRCQQLLKLLAAQYVKTEAYWLLDCKNHFIRKVSPDNIWASDGQLRTNYALVLPRFRKEYERACALFAISPKPADHKGLPTVTPMLMHRGCVIEMIEALEKHQQRSFPDLFMKGSRLTEFYLYAAYLQSLSGGLDTYYKSDQRQSFSLMMKHSNDNDLALALMEKLNSAHVISFGTHRMVLDKKDPAVFTAIKAVWRRFGLITEEKEFAYFTALPVEGWRRFLPWVKG